LVGRAIFEGTPDEGVAFVLDLTERKQAEALQQARQAAEAASRNQRKQPVAVAADARSRSQHHLAKLRKHH